MSRRLPARVLLPARILSHAPSVGVLLAGRQDAFQVRKCPLCCLAATAYRISTASGETARHCHLRPAGRRRTYRPSGGPRTIPRPFSQTAETALDRMRGQRGLATGEGARRPVRPTARPTVPSAPAVSRAGYAWTMAEQDDETFRDQAGRRRRRHLASPEERNARDAEACGCGTPRPPSGGKATSVRAGSVTASRRAPACEARRKHGDSRST